MSESNETPESTEVPETKEPQEMGMTPAEIFGKLDDELGTPPSEEEPLEEEEPETKAEGEGEETKAEGEEEPEAKLDEFGLPPSAEPKTPEPAPSESAELKAEREKNERLLKLLEEQAAAAKAKTEPEGKSEAELMKEAQAIASKYNFNVQPQFIEALQSEDVSVAQGSLNSIVLGVAVAVHQRTSMEFEDKLTKLREELSAKQSAQASSASAGDAANVFYGKYPQLNTEIGRNTVHQVAQELAAKGAVWNEETMLNIALEVRNRLKKSGLTLAKSVGEKKKGPFLGGGKDPKNPPETKPSVDDQNSPEAIKAFAGIS